MAPKNSEKIIRQLLELAEIQINGQNPWDIQVHDQRFYDRVLRESSLGLGEAYMDGWWDSEAVDQFIYRVLKAKLGLKGKRELENPAAYLSRRNCSISNPRPKLLRSVNSTMTWEMTFTGQCWTNA